jgi:hypothetical protein
MPDHSAFTGVNREAVGASGDSRDRVGAPSTVIGFLSGSCPANTYQYKLAKYYGEARSTPILCFPHTRR